MLNAWIRKWTRLASLVLRGGRKTLALGDDRYYLKSLFTSSMASVVVRETHLDEALRAALQAKEGAVLDVGANNGQTLLKLLSIDKHRAYIGFEPQLDCAFNIEQFIKTNSLPNHTILPVGLSDDNATVQLQKRYEGADESASIVAGFRPDDFYRNQQSIVVTSGDSLIPGMGLEAISVIKIDVEGGELEVIAGLEETLRRFKPTIFFEVLNHFLVVTGEELDQDTIRFREERNRKLEGKLRGLGYSIFNVLPDGAMREIERIEPKVSDDLDITDYVALHGNSRDSVSEHFRGLFVH